MVITVLCSLLCFPRLANAQEQAPQWVSDGPYLGEGPALFEIPLEVWATKLYVAVEIGGKLRRFVVDTGSPSMIDSALAKELGLAVVGTSQGIDSHGVVIKSDIVQPTIRLGGVVFQKVPMFSASFSASEATKAFIGDGVLGSEILPLGAWQIDLQNSVLRFNTEVTNLPFIGTATQTTLYDFGYPHAPILDVSFAKKASSKALFDTGSPAYFAISPDDLEGARKNGGVGRTLSGYGSAGSSLGGQAPDNDQLQVELKNLSIGEMALGRVGAVSRDLPPSLIGASILEHYVVTLDGTSGVAYFAQFDDGPFAQSSFGFTLAFNEEISMALVWDESAAAKAGLQPGMVLTAINGEKTQPTEVGYRSAISAMQKPEIHLEWVGGSATLSKKVSVLDKD